MALTSVCRECPECKSGKYSYICENIRYEYVGKVLQEYEVNRYDDSDFYAIVWNDETESLEHVEYNSTRHAGGKGCKVDATPDVIAKATDYVAAWLYQQNKLKAECERERPTVGKTVKSLTTRGKNHRAVGTIVAIDTTSYGYDYQAGDEAPWNLVCRVQIWGEIDPDTGEVIPYEGVQHPKLRYGTIPFERVEVLKNYGNVEPIDYAELARLAILNAPRVGFRLYPYGEGDYFYHSWLNRNGHLGKDKK